MATVSSVVESTAAEETQVAVSRTTVVAVGLALSAVVAAANLLGRPIAAVDTEIYAELEAVRNAYWTFTLVGGMSTALAYILAGIATCMLVVRRGATLATAGAILLCIGGVLFSAGFFASGAVSWVTTGGTGSDPAFFAYYQEHSFRAFAPQMIGFLLSTVGFILIGIALWRSQVVPRWFAAAIPVTAIVTILSGTGIIYDLLHAVFMGTVVALAWFLLRADRAMPLGAGE